MSAQASRYEAMRAPQFAVAVLCMLLVVVGSNILVQVPLNDWLTWGGLSYPVAFLVTDVLNRRFGPSAARRVAWFGFAAALVVSFWGPAAHRAGPGLAYICAQLVDIQVFDRLRDQRWWRAPLISGVLGAVLDTAVSLQRGLRRHGHALADLDGGRSGDQAGGQHQHAGAVPRADVEPGQAGQRLKPGGQRAGRLWFGAARAFGVWHRADIIETDRYIPGANAQD